MKKLLLIAVMLLLGGCSSLMFYPDSVTYRTPQQYGLHYEDHYFLTEEKTWLHGWWLKPEGESKGLMVVAHGNAENLSSHFTGWTWLVEAGYEVFIFDYRGYGKSGGKPGLEEAVGDTAAALEYAQSHYDGELFACGQSIGGALLINALAQKPYPRYRAAVIDSSYSDLERIGRDILSRSLITWPFQWMAYLLLDERYNPVEHLSELRLPLLFIAGSKDIIISPNHSWQLFDAAGRPKEFWLVTGAGHINAMGHPDIQKALLEYLENPSAPQHYSTMKIYDNLGRITKTQ